VRGFVAVPVARDAPFHGCVSGSGESSSWTVGVVGRGYKVALLVVVAAVLAIAAATGTAWAAGFDAVHERLVNPQWSWLAAALLAEAVAYLGYTLAYRDVVRAERGAELEVPKAAALVTVGFGVFLQGGGFSLDRQALKRAGLSESEARARVLGLGALEYALLTPATVAASIIVLLRGLPVNGSLTWPWIIGVPVGASVAFAALAFKRKLAGTRGWRRTVAHALRALELVLALARSLRRYVLAFVGMSLYWVGDIACLWSTLHIFAAHTPPVAQLIIGYATGYAITRRALPLGGAGIVEGLLPFSLGWVGIALAPAVLAAFAYRLINLWLPMVPALAGLPSLARLQGRSSHARHAAS
jgi:uncharacterized membrane protein YbhN (UPF0104 family)